MKPSNYYLKNAVSNKFSIVAFVFFICPVFVRAQNVSGVNSWSWISPAPYLTLAILSVMGLAIFTLVKAHKFLVGMGAEPSYNVFSDFLKWSSVNQKVISVSILLIVIAAVLWAI